MSRTEKALDYLNQLINDGMEYPDAVDIAAAKHRVKYERLQEAYDEDQCEN